MITVFSEDHELHHGKAELHRGELVPCFESPKRARLIFEALQKSGIGEIRSPDIHPIDQLLRVHDADYVSFLQSIHGQWRTQHGDSDALPHAWCVRRMQSRPPTNIYGRLGFYSSDAGSPIMAGTWRAAISSVNTALTAQQLIQAGEECAFALTRPPGHHAARDYYGGYCFLNNAAIAAQAFLDNGAAQVGILDIDFHHGNGTQDIFWTRSDVSFVSIHGDPRNAYPYFLGHADERGAKEGQGHTLNLPLPDGSDWGSYRMALDKAVAALAESAIDYLVVSLGVDTFEGDPISAFRLNTSDFRSLGGMISQVSCPTLFVMEGGYAIDELGRNVVNVLSGFERVH